MSFSVSLSVISLRTFCTLPETNFSLAFPAVRNIREENRPVGEENEVVLFLPHADVGIIGSGDFPVLLPAGVIDLFGDVHPADDFRVILMLQLHFTLVFFYDYPDVGVRSGRKMRLGQFSFTYPGVSCS